MNNNQHIRSSFDRDLEKIQAQMLKMGGLVEQAILESAKSFETRDTELADLVRSRDKVINRDADLAEDVIARDKDVDELYNGLFREFLTHMMEDPRNITACMHLHFMAKNIERMGDHVTSIAEQVVFLVTGEMPSEAREKGDKTSSDIGMSQD